MLPSNDETRASDRSPFVPVGAGLRGFQDGNGDVDLEPWSKTVRCLLEPIDPGIRGHALASKELTSGLARGERNGPGFQRGSHLDGGLRSRLAGGRFRNDERCHQIGPARRRQESGLAAERLSDQDCPRASETFYDCNDVSNVRSPREIAGSPLTSPVASLVERVDLRSLRQPRGGLSPLSSVTRESMEEQHRKSLTAEVAAGETVAVPCELEPGFCHQVILALSLR